MGPNGIVETSSDKIGRLEREVHRLENELALTQSQKRQTFQYFEVQVKSNQVLKNTIVDKDNDIACLNKNLQKVLSENAALLLENNRIAKVLKAHDKEVQDSCDENERLKAENETLVAENKRLLKFQESFDEQYTTLSDENERLKKETVNVISPAREGTLAFLYGKLRELLKANPYHQNSLVVSDDANILSSIYTFQCFANSNGTFMKTDSVPTELPSQKTNIIRIVYEKEFTLQDYYGLTGNDYEMLTFEKIRDRSFEGAEQLLEVTSFVDPRNRFCYSEVDGWIEEKDLLKGISTFTVFDLRRMLEPSKRTVMVFRTKHPWTKVKEILSLPKGELAKKYLEQ